MIISEEKKMTNLKNDETYNALLESDKITGKNEAELYLLKKENNYFKQNQKENINLNYYEKETTNKTLYITLQIIVNILLMILTFSGMLIFIIPLILNYVIFWFYTIFKILKYDFKYNKTVWILIVIFLPFLTIFFPAYEDDIIIKETQPKY